MNNVLTFNSALSNCFTFSRFSRFPCNISITLLWLAVTMMKETNLLLYWKKICLPSFTIRSSIWLFPSRNFLNIMPFYYLNRYSRYYISTLNYWIKIAGLSKHLSGRAYQNKNLKLTSRLAMVPTILLKQWNFSYRNKKTQEIATTETSIVKLNDFYWFRESPKA